MSHRQSPVIAACFIALLLITSPPLAQSPRGVALTGSISAAVKNGSTDLDVSGSLGYRFNSVFGLGVELSWIPTGPFDGRRVPTFGPILLEDADGDALIYTTNVRLEIPTTSRRLLPFVVGGGGVASSRQSFRLRYDPRLVIPLGALPPNFILSALPETSRTYSTSSTDLALTLGGGLSLFLTDHVSLDLDLRAVYVRGGNGGNIGRFGGGASYRF